MDAQDALRRVLADPRAGQGGRFEGGRMTAGPYEDEPILRTGAELAAARGATGGEPGARAGAEDAVDAAREERRAMRRKQRSRWPQTGAARQVARDMGAVWPGDDEQAGVSSACVDEPVPPRPLARADAGRRPAEATPAPARASLRVEAPNQPLRKIDLLAWEQPVHPEPPLPERYRLARDFACGPEARRHKGAWVFARQAEMLADVTDDCPYNGYVERYFPMYVGMTNAQLRGYVTWRTAVRAGVVARTSPSFVYVYVFELLACVGCASPEEAFERLFGFWSEYRELDSTLDRRMPTWLRDFVVYYGLPRATALRVPSIEAEVAFDAALGVMLAPEGHTPQERFEALSALSTYRIRSSRFAKEFPRDVAAVTLGVVSRLERHYAARRKAGLWESLFGRRLALPYDMFEGAVFDASAPHADAVFELDELNRYTCSGGSWRSDRIEGKHAPSSELGAVLKAVDARMRERFGYAHPLLEPEVPKYVAKYVEQEIDAWLAWKAEHTPRRIEIDRSKLGGIRTTAAATREELLVDEERGEEALGFAGAALRAAESRQTPPAPEAGPMQTGVPTRVPPAEQPEASARPAPVAPQAGAPTPAPPPAPAPAPIPAEPPQDAPAGLTAQELAFVRGLLAGAAEVPPGPLVSVDMLADAVNEKLFDAVGDVVVEFAGAGPAIIEDYVEDVRGIVGP